MDDRRRQVLGLSFFTGNALDAVETALDGGLVVAPSAPLLVELERDAASRDALLKADVVIADSGLMVLLSKLFQGQSITRVSGLEYIRLLLLTARARDLPHFFWIMPSEESRLRTEAYLRAHGIRYQQDLFYTAPSYPPGSLTDDVLLKMITDVQPAHIVIALGGGTQERLGAFLKDNLQHKPGIHCIGAAIAFLTGDQGRIPQWADRLYLGWLARCFWRPRRFVPRYWRARKLVTLMWRYRDRLPELAG